jgi:hypothetical protein
VARLQRAERDRKSCWQRLSFLVEGATVRNRTKLIIDTTKAARLLTSAASSASRPARQGVLAMLQGARVLVVEDER